MRIIFFIIQKEFLQIFRNKQILPLIFLMPIIQLMILANAATFEIKNINICINDGDNSSMSHNLINKIAGSKYFTIVSYHHSDEQVKDDISRGKAKASLIIPKNFEKDFYKTQNTKVQLIINAEDGLAAGLIQSYANAILSDFNRDIITDFHINIPRTQSKTINIIDRYWFNPELNYKFYMVPGILVILVTIVGMFLASMNVVKEKEIGTIEQINVTPVRKIHFIIGKLVPFWMIATFELAFGLFLAKLAFGIPVLGNLFLIFGLSSLYLIVVLSAGLLISTITETQQQAMFISWFTMVVFLLLSGLFTPVDSMPQWAKTVTLFNPMAHFVEIMRRVILKGSGFNDVLKQFLILVAFAVSMISLSIWRYKKSTS